jgi:tetratricopeptide (TPR) repeat protein
MSRVLLLAAVAGSTAGCAAGAGSGTALEANAGGRYAILIPDLTGPEGARVADRLRSLLADLPTHTSVDKGLLNRAMSAYEIEQLDKITARQLAQQINAENVLWGDITQGGAGLEANVVFIDVGSGDEILIDGITGADGNALAQAVATEVEQAIEGVRQAAFCNDYLSSQQFDRALENCNQALAIVPTSTYALYGKATALLNLERYEESLAAYEELLDLAPTHTDALLGAGLAASQLGLTAEAIAFYDRHLQVDPENVQVRMTVANAAAQAGDVVSAYQVLEPAISANSDNTDFQKYLFSIATAAGQRVQEEQDDAAARVYFQAAADAYVASYGTGTAELDANTIRQAIAVNNALGDTDAALSLARDATQRFDTVAAIWSQYASVLTDMEDHAGAIEALNRVAQLDPEYSDVYIRRAIAYMETGQQQRALADLERAAQRGDRERVAQVILSMASPHVQANRFGQAIDLLQLAQNYATGNIRSQVNFFLGYSYYKQAEAIARANTQGAAGNARRALALFQQAIPLLQATSEAQAPQVLQAARQYIENQQAIIAASGR